MRNIKKQILLPVVLAFATAASAHDFTVTQNGQLLYFNITSKVNKTAEVTYNGSIADKRDCVVSGDVEIPSKVKHENVVYTVTGIEAKAFANAKNLTGITMPSDLTSIGSFAFEGCTSLSKIIFGGKNLKFGQGVFFRCNSIKNVSFGNELKSINFAMFRWSDSLEAVSIPAKVEKIQNLKLLKHLKNISVDANNSHFSAYDGVLYTKDGKTLYACPRAFEGKLTVHEGTETIEQGSLADVPGITSVEFPASVKSFSFREFSQIKGLQSLIFHAMSPVTTAYANGKGCFVLQVANSDVKVYVPGVAKKIYKSELVQEAGEYKVANDGEALAFQVAATELPSVKNIIGVKNFETLK